MPFLDSLDIANRALTHCGVNPILSVTEDTTNNNEISAVYDKVRRAELRRNSWRFAIRRVALRAVDVSTQMLNPGLYDATKTYLQGEIVRDVNNLFWISQISDNLGDIPGGNNESWDMYFGPMTANLWNANTLGTNQKGYFSGEIVYLITGTAPQGYQLFMSLVNGNVATPNVTVAWDATVQYDQDQIASYLGSNWRSLIPVNLNNTPAVPPAVWAATTSYVTSNQVTGSDNVIYQAINSTLGNDPTLDTTNTYWISTGTLAAWTNIPTLPDQDTTWRSLTCTLKNLLFVYPIGAGPARDRTTANVFALPAGYVGPAPQNPKQGVMPFLGGPSGNLEPDWLLEGNFLVSRWSGPIIYRFVADVTKVRDMDDMFCEGLACRIAGMVCKRLTGSGELLTQISSMYKTFMGEARLKNGIESGTQEAYEDDYVAVRL